MGDKPTRYRLRLSRLDFVSLVDDPAQPNAKTLLIKRKGAAVEGETQAKFVKANDDLGVAFFWAFTSTNPDGSDHFDHHGDTIEKDNLVKIAMDFMLDGGGAVDEMHDGKSTDARAVAFPMDPEIAKAFGVETKTAGLMVMIKLNAEQLAKLKSGEYTGVSIAGLGTREPITKSTDKRYVTDEKLGHQHEVYCSLDSAWVTDATAEGATSAHRHTVLRDADGNLVVLSDAGHTHTLTEWPRVIVAPDDAVVVPEAKSTRSAPAVTVTSTKESKMDPQKEIEDLKARLAALESQLAEKTAEAELTDEEKSLAASLSATEQKRFRSLSKSDRAAEVAKAKEADPVVATVDGVQYRKSTPGSQLAVKIAAQEAEIEKAKVREIAKSTIGALAGDDATHDAIVKAIRTLPADMQEKALATLKGANAVVASKAVAPGSEGGAPADPAAPMEALTKGLVEFCTENKITKQWTEGYPKFIATDKGRELKRAVDESRNA